MTTDTFTRTTNPTDLERFLMSLQLAKRHTHKALTVWPLIAPPESLGVKAPPYVCLTDAVESGRFSIGEISESGSVPQVVADNRGDVAVLVLFGEELRGAKQNRIANATFLVGPRSCVQLPVSCVEAGRWARQSDAFAPSGAIFSSQSRSKMARRVADSRADGRGFAANQSEVWDEVESILESSSVASETRSYADFVDTHRDRFDEAERAFEPLRRQVGFVASIGDTVVGMEVVGRPEVFARVYRGLIGSYLVDAFGDERRVARPLGRTRGRLRAKSTNDLLARLAGEASPSSPMRFSGPEAFIRAVAKAPATRSASIGLGDDWRLRGRGIEACALLAGAVVQVTAFSGWA